MLARAQEVQNPMPPLRPLAGLEWRIPAKYATLSGDRLVIDIPEQDGPADVCATAKLPAALFGGAGGFAMEVEASGSNIAKPAKRHLGLKFQIHFKESATGREGYPNCAGETGDFLRKTLLNEVDFSGAHPDMATLMLGLQGTSGRVEFDLSTLRAAPTPGLFRRINEDWVVRYPASPDTAEGGTGDKRQATSRGAACRNVEKSPGESRVACRASPASAQSAAPASARRPLRGCMLPGRATTEEDIADLAAWGATMARFQISRRSDNADLAEYAAWVDSRLDNLEDVLRWAGERGMKICVDLHVQPGGSDSSGGQALFRDERYATAFVDTWRRIAKRCAPIVQTMGPVIYGYDLINEPLQNGRAPIDYWTIQRRAAEAVREIDPVTPIIVEANHWALPDAFSYLSPLAMDNVIYQVHVYEPHEFSHQGVGGRPIGPKWPDPEKGWTRDYLRDRLRPVREFEARHGAKIYVGEFSAATWAEGAENYLRDCIGLFEEYGWDWTYHAFREWEGWSVEHEGTDRDHLVPAKSDTPRKRALLEGFAR
ncbi:MAG: cellulase family glycosylhydrolase [Kiritimatiellae bacterium]|nr:cellulase family glycosylhydrolase [Kiritimatiellia bacterium]